MKFEKQLHEDQQIGVGAYKRAYKLDGPQGSEVLLKMKHEYTAEQMKGLFYLNKIATTLFPEHIAKVSQAGNSVKNGAVESQFVSRYHQPDADHEKVQSEMLKIDGQILSVDEETREDILHELEETLDRRGEKMSLDRKIQTFWDAYEDAGFLNESGALQISWGPQDIIFTQDGGFVFVDVDVPWDEPEDVGEATYSQACLRFDPIKLKSAIENIESESDRAKALGYYDRLITLARSAGFAM